MCLRDRGRTSKNAAAGPKYNADGSTPTNSVGSTSSVRNIVGSLSNPYLSKATVAEVKRLLASIDRFSVPSDWADADPDFAYAVTK